MTARSRGEVMTCRCGKTFETASFHNGEPADRPMDLVVTAMRCGWQPIVGGVIGTNSFACSKECLEQARAALPPHARRITR